MDDKIRSLAKYRIEKAEDDLKSAKLLHTNSFYSQSLNRSYYSIFHSVRALLAFDKFDSKKHSGIIAYFNKNYVKEGIIEKEFSAILMTAERIRATSDYDDLSVASKADAKLQLENAEKFIKRIRDYFSESSLCKLIFVISTTLTSFLLKSLLILFIASLKTPSER